MSFSFISFILILFLSGSHERSNEQNIELHVVSYEEFERFRDKRTNPENGI